MIGGALARPCVSYPTIFSPGTIWDRYPYLLPNLFSAATVFIGVVVGLLFLEETHVGKRGQRDRGREIGDRIAAVFLRASRCQGRNPEKQNLLANGGGAGYDTISTSHSDSVTSRDNEPLPAYRSQESSPRLVPRDDSARSQFHQPQPASLQASKPDTIFTRPVIMNIVSYGILAL